MKKLLPANPSTFLSGLLLVGIVIQSAPAFEPRDWNVRCWNSEEKKWQDSGLGKVAVETNGAATTITNTSGIHRHAHFVFPAKLEGDFRFEIELKGGYELGFLNREGKDEMLYVELGGAEEFETFELSRKGTRIAITRNGRAVPLVHFRFDYGEDFMITLAIKDGESATIRSYLFEAIE